jgi:putative OPT family oligopeptide transporter
MKNEENSAPKPLIGSDQFLPEITLKVILLSIILTIILAAANAYLGLKVGTTVSSSIPAAVISMAVLRFFRKHNVLENNMVQTAASVGEVLTSGVAYILPALLVLHYWAHFDYWQTFFISLAGGILGVLFSIPLRRALLNEKSLTYPEGTAIGYVLAASAKANTDIKPLVHGGIVGGVIALFQSGFRVFSDSWQFWVMRKTDGIAGFGLGFSPALIAAGYIVGPLIAVSLLVGIIISWVFSLQIISIHFVHTATQTPVSIAMSIWNTRLRYLGVGTMLIGGLWTLCTLMKPVFEGFKKSIIALSHARIGKGVKVLRTDSDIPIHYIGISVIFLAVCIYYLISHLTSATALGISDGFHLFISVLDVIYILIAGFFLSAISAYFAGLIGSTNNPVSGLLIAALFVLSLILLGLFHDAAWYADHTKGLATGAMAIMVCSIIGGAVALSNDTMQDLKAGQMVGSTPWKQQVMLLLGVVVAALVIPPVLELLFNAYGMAGIYPRAGMDPTQMLAAPQAGLMAAVTQGVFTHQLPWQMIGFGVVIAVICIFVDEFLKKRGLRLPVLAVGLGLYLPLDASTPVVIGGLLRLFIQWSFRIKHKMNENSEEARPHLQKGLILACGLVAGAALMGVLLAIPFAIAKNDDVLSLVSAHFTPIANWLSVIVTLGICYWIYHTAVIFKVRSTDK